MGMLRRVRKALRMAYLQLRIWWTIKLIVAGPSGRALYGCLALLVVLHVPLLVAGIVALVAQRQGTDAAAWTKGVLGLYFIIWMTFAAVSRDMGDADPSPPMIDEPVIDMVYEMQGQPMSEEEVERLAVATTAVMDTGMQVIEIVADEEEKRKRLWREGEEG